MENRHRLLKKSVIFVVSKNKEGGGKKMDHKKYESFSLEEMRKKADENKTSIVLEINKWIESVKKYSQV